MPRQPGANGIVKKILNLGKRSNENRGRKVKMKGGLCTLGHSFKVIHKRTDRKGLRGGAGKRPESVRRVFRAESFYKSPPGRPLTQWKNHDKRGRTETKG